VPTPRLVAAAMPFYVVNLVVLVMVAAFPEIVMLPVRWLTL
jgi:TRAP-type C4-dicarboxylate transport system permease large subunit